MYENCHSLSFLNGACNYIVSQILKDSTVSIITYILHFNRENLDLI